MLSRVWLRTVSVAKSSVVAKRPVTMATRAYASAPDKKQLNIRPEPDKVSILNDSTKIKITFGRYSKTLLPMSTIPSQLHRRWPGKLPDSAS